MANLRRNGRHQSCYQLIENNIPCVVWCEDAVAHYGVPTGVFDVYVLVPNIEEAAAVLVHEGWTLEDTALSNFGLEQLNRAHRRLAPPVDGGRELITRELGMPPPRSSPKPQATILLPAAEWNFVLPDRYQRPREGPQISVFPPLPSLLDALIDSLLDDPLDSMIWNHLAVLIGYLYEYVPVLKEKSFAEKLEYSHRQFHFDILSGMSFGTIPSIAHQRPIRDALRQGTYQLRDCSASPDDETLFTAKLYARLKALNGSPFLSEDYERLKQESLVAEIAEWEADESIVDDRTRKVNASGSHVERNDILSSELSDGDK